MLCLSHFYSYLKEAYFYEIWVQLKLPLTKLSEKMFQSYTLYCNKKLRSTFGVKVSLIDLKVFSLLKVFNWFPIYPALEITVTPRDTLKFFDSGVSFLDFSDNLLWKIWPKKTPCFRIFCQ